MSDLADIGSSQLGYANLAASQAGGPSITSQANTSANTALVGQQTQGEEIKNQNARLQYQLFANAVGHIHDFDGQDGPSLGKGADDASGVTATSALPGADAPPALKGKITPEMDVGASASDQALIESSLEQNFNVNKMGTPQEQQAIMQASKQAQAWALSGNPGMAKSAEQKLEMMKNLRDMNVATRQNAAEVEASGHYDKLSAVVNAPDGKAWDTLMAVAPDSADNIKRQNPNATPEELEEIARDTSAHVAGFMHRFTDRPVKVGDDQVMYDEKSGQKVDGIPMRGVDPARQAELLKQATEVKTFKNSDGTETTEEQYKHDGYANPNLWVTHAVNDIRARNAASNAIEVARSKAARVPPQPPGQPGQPQPGVQPGQDLVSLVNRSRASRQRAQASRRPRAQPPPDNGLLPGVNPDALPKVQSAPVTQGTSQKPGDLKTQEGVAAESLVAAERSELRVRRSSEKRRADPRCAA